MKKNKKYLKILSIITFIVSILLIIGGSYATLNFDALIQGTKESKISSCKLKLKLKDENAISLLEAYPISDDKITSYQPYKFTITNNSSCDRAYYKITLGDLCTTCSKTNNICTVNGQELNCSNTYKINSNKIKLQLLNKTTNLSSIDNNPENFEYTGALSKDESISFELKLWIDSAATNEDLYVYENGKPKENADGSIITKNAGFKLNVEGQDKQFNLRNKDNSGANEPMLVDNMIPVYYDSTTEVWRKADETNSNSAYKWYDYNQKEWANVATVTETNRSTYLTAAAGTEISMNDINSMWVWIPRYKYTYFKSNKPVSIPITFEKGTQTTGTINCTEAINQTDKDGNIISEICTDTKNGSITMGKSTYTHPAFTFGETDLTGIWMGKFGVSALSDSEFEIKPNKSLVGTNNRLNAFQFGRTFDFYGNNYGFKQTGTTGNMYTGEIVGDSNNIDTHLIKNSEWGLVAYFSHSDYGLCTNGKCRELGHNNTLTTGCGMKELEDVYGATYQTECLETNRYNKKDGLLASTTNNVYGVYDLVGHNNPVMGNMVTEKGEFYDNTAGWAKEFPLDKYYDKYSYDTDYAINARGKLGDGTLEVWNDGMGLFVASPQWAFIVPIGSWFYRGGVWLDYDSEKGLFSYNGWPGGKEYLEEGGMQISRPLSETHNIVLVVEK